MNNITKFKTSLEVCVLLHDSYDFTNSFYKIRTKFGIQTIIIQIIIIDMANLSVSNYIKSVVIKSIVVIVKYKR